MEELIEMLQSIKDEVKDIKSCTIVLKMNDDYTHKLITHHDWGCCIEEIP